MVLHQVFEEERVITMAIRCWLLMGVVVAAGLHANGGGLAAEPSPEKLLTERGLDKHTDKGIYWIVAGEKGIVDSLRRIGVLISKMAIAGDKVLYYQNLEAEIEHWQNTRINLEAERDLVMQQIPQMPQRNPQEKAAVIEARAYLNQVNQNITVARAETEKRIRARITPARMQKLQDDFEKEKKIFLAAEEKLRPAYDDVKKQYNELQADLAVKNAVTAYASEKKVRSKLGPSPLLTGMLNKMLDAEVTYSPETAPQRAKKKRPKGRPVMTKERTNAKAVRPGASVPSEPAGDATS
jgi:hypothetical protein